MVVTIQLLDWGYGRWRGLGIGNAFPFFFSASNLSILSFRKYRSYMHIYIYQNHPYPTIHPHIPTSPNLDNPLELFTPQANRAIPRTLKSSILTDIRTPHLSLLFFAIPPNASRAIPNRVNGLPKRSPALPRGLTAVSSLEIFRRFSPLECMRPFFFWCQNPRNHRNS